MSDKLLYSEPRVSKEMKRGKSYDTTMPALQLDLIILSNFPVKQRQSQGKTYRYILNIIEQHSRKMYATPLETKSQYNVLRAIESLLNQIMSDNPSVAYSRSDDDRSFGSKLVKLMSNHGITHKLINTSEKPKETVALIERANKSLMSLLTPMIHGDEPGDLVDKVSDALEEYNDRIHSITQCTPNSVVDGTCEPQTTTESPDNTFKITDLVLLRIPRPTQDKFMKRVYNWYPEPYMITAINELNHYHSLINLITGEDYPHELPRRQLRRISKSQAEDLSKNSPKHLEIMTDQVNRALKELPKDDDDDWTETRDILTTLDEDLEQGSQIATRTRSKMSGGSILTDSLESSTDSVESMGSSDTSLINFDEMLPRQDWLDIDDSVPKFPFRCLIAGPSNAGKTNLLFNILHNKVYFDNLFLYYKNATEPLYELMVSYIRRINDERRLSRESTGLDTPRDIFLHVGHTMNDIIPIEEVEGVESLWRDPESGKMRQSIVVFDDFITEKNQEQLIGNYFVYSRKLGFSCFYISQSFHKTPAIIRQNLSAIMHFRLSKRQSLELFKSHGEHLDKSEWESYTNQAWSKNFGFIQIDLSRAGNDIFKIGLSTKAWVP